MQASSQAAATAQHPRRAFSACHPGWLAISALLLVACTSLRPSKDVLRVGEGQDQGPANGAGDANAGVARDASTGTRDAAGDAPFDAGVDDSMPCPDASARELKLLTNLQLDAGAHFSCAHDYEIDGYVVVTSGTLRIDPGVVVRARQGAFLLIGQNARIEANGTSEAPIVFTAATHPAKPGTWRGLLLLGRAQTALTNGATLGLPPGDPRAFFGGNDDEHDCGVLRYVRIEFAGGSTNEYDFPGAALTLAGCGRRSQIEHVQVHASTDGIGLIGGSAPLKRVLVSAASADGIEWAAGYTGFIQFAIVQTFYGAGAALKGSRSEADEVTPPASAPVIFNATLLGANVRGLPQGAVDPNGFETGVQLQAGSRLTLRNALVYGFAGAWIDVIGASTAGLVGTDTLVTNTIFADSAPRKNQGLPGVGVERGDGEDDDGGFSEDESFRNPSLQNRFPTAGFTLRDPYAATPLRPDVSADGFVDGGNLADMAPPGWAELWEPAFYAGALPKIQSTAERALDWTRGEVSDEARAWTAFPEE